MELNITEFFNTANAFDYQASRAEIGDNAGMITWHNAINADYVLLADEDQRQSFREYVKSTGGWNQEEIQAFNDNSLNALCIQFVSGFIRDFEDFANSDWEKYEELSQEGAICGSMSKADDNQVYVYFGN